MIVYIMEIKKFTLRNSTQDYALEKVPLFT